MSDAPASDAPAAPDVGRSPEASPGAVVIVGAGPGIGASVARRFARAGHAIGLIARNRNRLEELVGELTAQGASAVAAVADATHPDEIREAIADVRAELGRAQVLCVSALPDVGLIGPIEQTSAEDLAAALALGVVGTAAAVGAALPDLRATDGATVLLTTGGAVLNPTPQRASSAIVGAAQASQFRLLHDALAPSGIHVVHAVIAGAVGPGLHHEPADIAEALWREHVGRDQAQLVLR